MKIGSYKELDVWKKGIEIVAFVYDVTDKFPKNEIYGLVAHMRKTAISIPSNIAEGYARRHAKEFRQFCYISLGSCSELETQSIIANLRKYISEPDNEKLEEMLDHESRMLRNLIKRVDTWKSR